MQGNSTTEIKTILVVDWNDTPDLENDTKKSGYLA